MEEGPERKLTAISACPHGEVNEPRNSSYDRKTQKSSEKLPVTIVTSSILIPKTLSLSGCQCDCLPGDDQNKLIVCQKVAPTDSWLGIISFGRRCIFAKRLAIKKETILPSLTSLCYSRDSFSRKIFVNQRSVPMFHFFCDPRLL
jgi:hypothetical protein